MNMWPLITGENTTSPRTEIPINGNVLIQNNYKYMVNASFDYASWGNYIFPNSSSPQHPIQGTTMDCKYPGCLFDLDKDMTEHNNIVNENMDIVKKMDERLVELSKGFYNNKIEGTVSMCPKDINISCGWGQSDEYSTYQRSTKFERWHAIFLTYPEWCIH